MRFQRNDDGESDQVDLTPMIDIVFQLVAFFMVVMNFTQVEQDERIQLPHSVLAKPPDAPLSYPITVHMTEKGSVIIAGQELFLEGLRPYLLREAAILKNRETPLDDATIVIRGHKNARTGEVQSLIRTCQENGFENFSLRAREDMDY